MLGAREAGAQVQEMPFRLTRTNNARCESRLKEDLEGDLGKGGFGGGCACSRSGRSDRELGARVFRACAKMTDAAAAAASSSTEGQTGGREQCGEAGLDTPTDRERARRGRGLRQPVIETGGCSPSCT